MIGAGIVGASIAHHLAARGARVTVLERERPAAAASGRSFGWINASFGHPDAYQQLRYLAMLEYLRLEREVPGIQVNWSGSLVWLPDAAGDSLARLVRAQQRRGYPVRSVEAREFAALEPRVRPAPALAAFAEREAAVDPAHTTVALLEAAQKSGAQVRYPVTVTGFDLHGDRLRAVETGDGAIGVDVAVLAAGVDTPRLAREAQLRVPLKESPALLLRTRPLEQTAARILVTPQAQVKQQVDGRVVVGVGPRADLPAQSPEGARETLAAAQTILPGLTSADLESATPGLRPMPDDELPIVGFAGPVGGVYVAVTHSGVTLAALIGRLVASEILEGAPCDWLAPYRLSRFGAGG